MAQYYSGSARCTIPLLHKCSHCGSAVFSNIPLEKSYTKTYKVSEGSLKLQMDAAQRVAIYELRNEIKEIYKLGPLKCRRTIIGTCPKCNRQELWQTSRKEATLSSILVKIAAILFFAIGIVIPLLLNKPGLIPVFLIGESVLLLALIFGASTIAEKFPSRKTIARQQALENIPEENRPAFMLPLEQVLEQVTYKSETA